MYGSSISASARGAGAEPHPCEAGVAGLHRVERRDTVDADRVEIERPPLERVGGQVVEAPEALDVRAVADPGKRFALRLSIQLGQRVAVGRVQLEERPARRFR